MKPHETEEYALLKHWFSGEDCKAILLGEHRRSWASDSKQLEVMTKWHADDEAGKEAYRQGWRDAIAKRAAKAEARQAAEQEAAKATAISAETLEETLRATPSAFQDIPGLALSKLFAGTYPLPEFWEKHWTAETKDRTRHLLANIGLGIRKVETPANLLEKSFSRYELAPRTKHASEKLMELPALPSGKQWENMTADEREMRVEDDKKTFKAAGVTAAEIKGISARHIYEICHCSRRESEILVSSFRRNGALPTGAKLKTHFTEKTGVATIEELAELPLNMVKALILAYSGSAVARHWEGRSSAADMAEEMRVWASEGYKPSRAPFFVNI